MFRLLFESGYRVTLTVDLDRSTWRSLSAVRMVA